MYRHTLTREDLRELLAERLGLSLPDKPFTAGHSTPLDFVADAVAHPGRDLAAWANRSGLKTLSASVIGAIEFLLGEAPFRAVVLSGSEEQARNLYEYWARWCSTVLKGLVVDGPHRLVTRLTNGEFEILSASQKRVRGPKVQRLFRDEVDEIDRDVYGASVGMLAALPGVPARTIDTSTWHRVDGPMGDLIAGAAGRGVKLHRWNIWETLEQCPVERHDHGRGCRSCGLAGACVPKAQEFHGQPRRELGIAADGCGLLAIDDAIRQFRQWSFPQWQAEAECRRPTVEGLVYPAFDRTVHVRADLDFDDDLPTCRAIDWGWKGFMCLWVQHDKSGRVRVVDEYWAPGTTVAEHAWRIRDRDRLRRIEATYCDPAGRSPNDQTGYSDVDFFGSIGIPCTYTTTSWAREVRNGINLIRSFLAPADGPTRLLVAGRCTQLIRAFESYRSRRVNGQYVDEPVKPQECDHAMDALRYYFVNRWPTTRTELRQLSYA